MANPKKKATDKAPKKTKTKKAKTTKTTKPKAEKKSKSRKTKKPAKLGGLAEAAGMQKVGTVRFGGKQYVCIGSQVKNRSGKKIPKVFCRVA